MSETKIAPGSGRLTALRKALRGKRAYVMAVGFGEFWVRIPHEDALAMAARVPDRTILVTDSDGAAFIDTDIDTDV